MRSAQLTTLALCTLALGLAACAPQAKQAQQTTAPATSTPATATPTTPATTPAATYTPVAFLSEQPVRKFTAAKQVLDPARKYRAVLTTSKGVVTVDLNSTAAPIAVNSFVFLSLNHFYDGLTFHRVVNGFVAQGGDPEGTGAGGPGYSFTTETSPTARFDSAGVLGMARAQSRDSNGSQFFITLAPADFLTGDYSVFGKVVDGQKAVDALTKTENGSARPDTIVSVQILSAAR
ncbi:peptidylprolyl isomerase [Deinococcus aquiradiocola]|nr:peptidylprolyl isomerase [Deinococcus aquiradiocola]